MKALLICPAERPALTALAQRQPLAALPVLGLSLVEYWLQHFAALGATQVTVLASDRPGTIAALVGDGARWGLEVEVVPVRREPSCAEARAEYCDSDDGPWLAAPHDVVAADFLPGLPGSRLFGSYADLFATALAWMPHARTPDRVGLRELRPGVRVGFHARISPAARIEAPCWIGDDVFVGAGAVIGPHSILENRVLVEAGAQVHDSMIGPDTFVGGISEVAHSLAWGHLLIDWRSDSVLRVQDDFLLGSLERMPVSFTPRKPLHEKTGALTRVFSSPFAGLMRGSTPATAPRPAGTRSLI